MLLLSGQAEPTITLNLVPADAAGTTFNLTPVLNSSSGEQYTPPPASSAPHTPGGSRGGGGCSKRVGGGGVSTFFLYFGYDLGSGPFIVTFVN